jgi:hypothetical protein
MIQDSYGRMDLLCSFASTINEIPFEKKQKLFINIIARFFYNRRQFVLSPHEHLSK